jgi:hypothetical protein
MGSPKIHCANCLRCKVFVHASDLTGAREQRVKCKARLWRTPAGWEKTFALHTVLNRQRDQCTRYDSMGEDDLKEYLADLRATLPVERIIEMPRGQASPSSARP